MLSDHHKTVVAVWGTSVFLLCANQELLSRFGIASYVNQYRALIAMAALYCSVRIVVELVSLVASMLGELVSWQARIRRKDVKRRSAYGAPERIVFRMN